MPTSRSQGRIVVACTAAYCIANVGWWVQPAIINEAMVRYRIGESQSGLVASAEMTAIALGSILVTRLFGRFTLRQIALTGIVVTLLGALSSFLAASYEPLLTSRALTGLGEGAMLAVATAALANFKDPDRAYGKINIVAILFGSLASFSLPFTAKLFGESHNVFPTLLVSVALLSTLVPLMPKNAGHGGGASSNVSVLGNVLSLKLVSLAIAVFIIGVTSGAMWSFFFPLGKQAGLTDSQIEMAVSLSALISVSGALSATMIGATLGRFLPVTIGIVALTAAIVMISHWHSPSIFFIGACLNPTAMYFLAPYFLAYAAAQDASGRNAAIVGGVFLLTGAAGPYFGGYIFENFDVGSMTWIVIGTNIFAWMLFVIVERAQRSRGLVGVRLRDDPATP